MIGLDTHFREIFSHTKDMTSFSTWCTTCKPNIKQTYTGLPVCENTIN